MAVGLPPPPSPRWGETDPQAASVALGVTIPLAIFVTVLVLWVGRQHAPIQQSVHLREYTASTLASSS